MAHCFKLIILFLLIVLPACTHKQEPLSEQERIGIFQNKYAAIPDKSFQTPDHVLVYYQYNEQSNTPSFVFLKEKKSQWEEIRRHTLSENYYGADSIRMVTLDEKPYLYFEEYMEGGSLGNYSINFSLYDYREGKIYYVNYEYYPNGDLPYTKFTKSDNLQSQLKLLNFLEAQGYASPRIHQLNEVENLTWNFFNENSSRIDVMNKVPDQWVELNPIETNMVLFDLNDREAAAVAEDENFVVAAFSKGSVYAYEKSTQKYRLIWPSKNPYEWIGGLKFEPSGHLIMYLGSSNYSDYWVDLPKSAYMKLDKNKERNLSLLLPENTQEIENQIIEETKSQLMNINTE